MTYRTKLWLWGAGSVLLALSSVSAWSDSPLNERADGSQGQNPAAVYPNSGNDTGQQPGGTSQPPITSALGRQGAARSPQVLNPGKEQPKVAVSESRRAPVTRHQAQ